MKFLIEALPGECKYLGINYEPQYIGSIVDIDEDYAEKLRGNGATLVRVDDKKSLSRVEGPKEPKIKEEKKQLV